MKNKNIIIAGLIGLSAIISGCDKDCELIAMHNQYFEAKQYTNPTNNLDYSTLFGVYCIETMKGRQCCWMPR
jgi:hypothetical protein